MPEMPRDVEQAVRAAYTASVTAGQPLSQRAVAERFGLSRREGGGSMNRYGVIAQWQWAW